MFSTPSSGVVFLSPFARVCGAVHTAHYYPTRRDGVIPTFIPFWPLLEEEEEEGSASFALRIGGGICPSLDLMEALGKEGGSGIEEMARGKKGI
ncbi:hypothetical protein B9Z19DRAFT_1085473, partial [Tuber borchii]